MAPTNGNDDLFFVPKMFLNLCGFCPMERQTRVSVAIGCFNLILQITHLTTTLVSCLRNDDPFEYWECADFLVTIAIFVIIRAYGGQIVLLIKATVDDSSSITDPKEKEIMITHKRMGSYYFGFLFTYTVACFTFSFFSCLSYLEQTFKDVFLAQAADITALWAWFVLECSTSFCRRLTAYGVDLLFWSLATQLSAHFKIQTLRYQKFLLIKSKSESKKLLRRLVERHIQVLELYGVFEGAFHLYVALRVLWLPVRICIQAYIVVAYIYYAPFPYVFSEFGDLISNLSSLYVFFYVGDYLTSCSEDIGEVFRQSKWYTLSKDSRINFSIIILRTQAMRSLTAGKLYKLNLLNFQYVVQSVYWFMSLIAVMGQE